MIDTEVCRRCGLEKRKREHPNEALRRSKKCISPPPRKQCNATNAVRRVHTRTIYIRAYVGLGPSRRLCTTAGSVQI